MKTNYHSHTYLCGHASLKPVDYIEQAIKEGYIEYGISDHCYLNEKIKCQIPKYPWLKYQMEESDFKEKYLPMIDEAITLYQGQIRIHKGIEAEFVYDSSDFYKKILEDCEYIILGLHYLYDEEKIYGTRGMVSKRCLQLYTQFALDGLNSGFFKIFAHPDIFMYDFNDHNFDNDCLMASRKMIESAIENNVYLEFNLGGVRKGLRDQNDPFFYYPNNHFWEVVKEYPKAKVIISGDTHDPIELCDNNYDFAYNYLMGLGIKPVLKIF